MNELTIRIDTSVHGGHGVHLLIDGEDVLAETTGNTEPGTPASILASGALIPADPPRRIAFYGCSCGEFGCGNVAGIVVRRGSVVQWTDFCSVTGEYGSALPPDEPDPVVADDWDLPPDRYDLPTYTFNAERYLATVRAAASAHP